MAIYHMTTKTISRSRGQSAVASAAYRAGVELTDERTGQIHSYEKKGGIVQTEILLPPTAPEAFADRSQLWNAVEATEKRKDAQLAREIVVALPAELDGAERQKLVREFAESQFVSRGMIADIAIHKPNRKGDQSNHHAHIMLTMREVDNDGFGKKNREWNSKELLHEWREQWAEHCNRALEKNGHSERIDHRSYEAQGIAQVPTEHLGHAASALERRGIATERGDYNRTVRQHNNQLRQRSASLTAAEEPKLKPISEMTDNELVENWSLRVQKRTLELSTPLILEYKKQKESRAVLLESRQIAIESHDSRKPSSPQKTLLNRISGAIKRYERDLSGWEVEKNRIWRNFTDKIDTADEAMRELETELEKQPQRAEKQLAIEQPERYAAVQAAQHRITDEKAEKLRERRKIQIQHSHEKGRSR